MKYRKRLKPRALPAVSSRLECRACAASKNGMFAKQATNFGACAGGVSDCEVGDDSEIMRGVKVPRNSTMIGARGVSSTMPKGAVSECDRQSITQSGPALTPRLNTGANAPCYAALERGHSAPLQRFNHGGVSLRQQKASNQGGDGQIVLPKIEQVKLVLRRPGRSIAWRRRRT